MVGQPITFRFRVVSGMPDSGPFGVEIISLETGYQCTFDLAQELVDRTSFPAMEQAWQAVSPQHRLDPNYWPKIDLWFDGQGNIIHVVIRCAADS